MLCSECKPVLFPYVEYGYKAELQKLAGSKIISDGEIIDFHGMRFRLMKGWSYEKVFSGRTIKFYKDKSRFFILSFSNNKDIHLDNETFKMVGCKNFSIMDSTRTKTKKEFYTDLYLFTDEQLSGNPTFWQYYILWAKTEFLHNAIKLTHYRGKNLEAFQRISDPKTACTDADIIMRSVIFPNKIAPAYLKVTAVFRDDAFFQRFFNMLDAMNP
jgi:hypothetical protein